MLQQMLTLNTQQVHECSIFYGGALSVTPVRACVRLSMHACVRPLSKFGVRSIT